MLHVGERGAGVGRIRGDLSGKLELDPILTGKHPPGALQVLGLVLPDPGDQGGRGRGERSLTGERQRPFRHTGAVPALKDAIGSAIQREYGRTDGIVILIHQVQSIAVTRYPDRQNLPPGYVRALQRLTDRDFAVFPDLHHVPLDPVRTRDTVRAGALPHAQLPAGQVTDNGLCNRQTYIYPQQTGSHLHTACGIFNVPYCHIAVVIALDRLFHSKPVPFCATVTRYATPSLTETGS